MLLVLGTRNRKKGLELVGLLSPWGFECRTLADCPNAIDVAETGDSFAENARLKAVEQAAHLGQWVLGEDSGLVVDALDVRRECIPHDFPDRRQPMSRTIDC